MNETLRERPVLGDMVVSGDGVSGYSTIGPVTATSFTGPIVVVAGNAKHSVRQLSQGLWLVTTGEAPRALPRRANTIRAVAATMAHKKMTEVGQRQAVSDRIGYMVAVVLGAIAMTLGGRPAVAVVLGLYGAVAFRAYRRWRAMVDQ